MLSFDSSIWIYSREFCYDRCFIYKSISEIFPFDYLRLFDHSIPPMASLYEAVFGGDI